MNWRVILWPLSLIYGAVTGLRNLAFNIGLLKSESFDRPVIAIGNLSTGGTGKTPMTEFILEYAKAENPSMVSRGYGRKTKGLLLADEQSSATDIGDEPFQIHRKFKNAKVVVSEKRIEGISKAIQVYNPDIVVLDDAFQHRYVKPSFQILLSTYNKPYYEDFILPAGNLREARSGKKRADIVVVSKCPDNLDEDTAKKISRKLKVDPRPIFFSSLTYELPQNHVGEPLDAQFNLVLVIGIAKPAPFIKKIESDFTNISTVLKFSDHHSFSDKDLAEMKRLLDEDDKARIITTEKDWVRLIGLLDKNYLDRIFYLPIKVKILFDQREKFLSLVNKHITEFSNQD